MSFCSCSLGEHWLIFLLRRLVCLILWCCLLRNVFIMHLFFLVSALTIFQSWFLRDGYVGLFWHLFSLWSLNYFFSFCVSLCFEVFEFVVFWLLLLCISIWFEGAYFSVFGVSILVSGSCWHDSLLICWCISNILRSENQPFFVIVLTWSMSLWLVVLNLVQSSKISINLFLYSLCMGLLQT